MEIAFERTDLETTSLDEARAFIQKRLLADSIPRFEWKKEAIATGIAERPYLRALKDLGLDMNARSAALKGRTKPGSHASTARDFVRKLIVDTVPRDKWRQAAVAAGIKDYEYKRAVKAILLEDD